MKKPRPLLPVPCSLCRPYEGRFRDYGTATAPRMDRCDCDRGKALGMGARWYLSRWWKAKQQHGAAPPTKRKASHDGRAAGAGKDA